MRFLALAAMLAAFPLAIPLLAGPGAITATILLAGQAAYRPAWLAALLAWGVLMWVHLPLGGIPAGVFRWV